MPATLAPPPAPPGIDTGGLLPPAAERRVAAFMDAACAVLPRYFRASCCIAATRLACDVLGGRFGLSVRPLTCEAWVMNPAAVARLDAGEPFPSTDEQTRRWQDAGAWVVTVGEADAPGLTADGRPGWPGHLVALVGGRVLLDPSLAQAARPHKNVHAHPLVGVTGPDVLDPAARRWPNYPLAGGGRVVYVPRPADHSYRDTTDWRNKTFGPVIDELAARVAAAVPPQTPPRRVGRGRA